MKYPQVVSMPLAVSNWLDEQLEARGVDAVVYTRYILSLLHSHTVDVLYPEEDFQFSHSKKEVRRFNRGHIGSQRSSADWWEHAHVDAERIKRLAAVECLLSASEQNSEIESLVDELCEKLKKANSDNTIPVFSSSSEAITENSTASKDPSPEELAKNYYAAFPPLRPQLNAKESKLLPFIPNWRNVTSSSSSSSFFSSPAKNKSAKKAGKPLTCTSGSFKEHKDVMKARNQTKPRLGCFGRNKNTRNTTFNIWDIDIITHNNIMNFSNLKKKEDQSEVEEADQCVDISKDLWNNENEMNMYEDLPVDIIDLLDSPRPHNDTVKMMNIVNMRDTGKKKFIPYGTNIMSSIWSTDQDITFDNNFNTSIDVSSKNNTSGTEMVLDYKFSSISIDNPSKKNINFNDWPSANSSVENETNALFENSHKSRRKLFANEFNSLPEDWSVEERNMEADKETFETEKLLAYSLMKLNHNTEKSCFKELTPGSITKPKPFDPFGKPSNAFNFTPKYTCNYMDNSDKEDLLTSERSCFQPICEKTDELLHQTTYADGSTFAISSNLEKKSENGRVFSETESETKRHGFKTFDSTPVLNIDEFMRTYTENNKYSEIEDCALDEEVAMYNRFASPIKYYQTPQTNAWNEEHQIPNRCTCPDKVTSASNKENSKICPIHVVQRPESKLSEVVWKYDESCEKCFYITTGSSNSNIKGQMASDWDKNGLRNIWKGGEVCQNCLNINGFDILRPTPNHQLREDISQDGEELLSDLRTIQECHNDDLHPDIEHSFDMSNLISNAGAYKERKRRHSLIADGNLDAWTFDSRYAKDSIMQLVTFPASRAVTL